MPSSRSTSALRLLWLDVLAILAWGILLLRFWLTGRINILLHPDYVWLAIAAGIVLVGIGVIKLLDVLQLMRSRRPVAQVPHINFFPPGWGSALMLMVALFGLQFTPRAFASQMALDRGVTDTLTMTRSQPQAFRAKVRTEDKSLVDWVRTLNVYPEPDAYTGQAARIEGFVIHTPNLPDNYLTLARFVITCCAADTYPVGLPIKLATSRTAYPQDQWFRVEGTMLTETVGGMRQLVVQAKSLTKIPEPENPYDS